MKAFCDFLEPVSVNRIVIQFNVSRETARLWRLGDRIPHRRYHKMLCDFLGITLEQLYEALSLQHKLAAQD